MTRLACIQLIAFFLLASGPYGAQAPSAVREALGGDARLRALKALQMTGTVVSGFNGATAMPLDDAYPVDIRIAFPDRYLRVEDTFGMRSRMGFNGDAPIFDLRSTRTGGNVMSGGPDAGFVKRSQARIAHVMLGMLGDAKGILDLSMKRKAGAAPVLVVSGPASFLAEIDLDPRTHLPVRVRYRDSLFIRAPLTAEDKKAGRMNAGKTENVEVAIAFEDRRVVDGLLLPHRIVRTVKGVRWESLRFDRILVNPPLKPADFK